MLTVIAMISISVYFIILPLFVKILCKKLKRKVPGFFTYGEMTKFIVMSFLVALSCFRTNEYVPMIVRVFSLVCVVVCFVDYLIGEIDEYRKPEMLKDKDKCVVAYYVFKFFGDKAGYKYLCGDDCITKEEWRQFKLDYRNSTLSKKNKKELEGFVSLMKEEAIDKSDNKLMLKVCKISIELFDKKDYYNELLSDSYDGDDMSTHELMISNYKLFKEMLV